MLDFYVLLVFVILQNGFCNSFPDLTPEAITVYRNPEFFKNLNYDPTADYNVTPTEPTQDVDEYKYPGEPKKPNPPPPTSYEVNYDNSPEFHPEPRDIFVDTTHKPSGRKNPYIPRHRTENNVEEESSYTDAENPSSQEQSQEEDEEENTNESKNYTEDEEENTNESKNYTEDEEENTNEAKNYTEDEEEPEEYRSVLSPEPDEEYKSYHEPILLARTDFDPNSSSEHTSSTYNQPYSYNRSNPILYEDWKHYTYPKIHAHEYIKSDPPLYSEEPASNSFEADRSTSYLNYDDEPEEGTDSFSDGEYKNLGADTKHIYKKLLKPKFKPSILFKLHSKPKIKKLKLKVKKGHLHGTRWFDEYPFNF